MLRLIKAGRRKTETDNNRPLTWLKPLNSSSLSISSHHGTGSHFAQWFHLFFLKKSSFLLDGCAVAAALAPVCCAADVQSELLPFNNMQLVNSSTIDESQRTQRGKRLVVCVSVKNWWEIKWRMWAVGAASLIYQSKESVDFCWNLKIHVQLR